ncbi:MAG: hypothetical protein IPK14_02700 [Blastocatellia bacterium]|nr:hypothetical protein [Blastocatellia bacterium]
MWRSGLLKTILAIALESIENSKPVRVWDKLISSLIEDIGIVVETALDSVRGFVWFSDITPPNELKIFWISVSDNLEESIFCNLLVCS